jgi:hypothetical protein
VLRSDSLFFWICASVSSYLLFFYSFLIELYLVSPAFLSSRLLLQIKIDKNYGIFWIFTLLAYLSDLNFIYADPDAVQRPHADADPRGIFIADPDPSSLKKASVAFNYLEK